MNQMKISNLFKYHAQGALKIHFVQNGSLAIFNSQHDLEKAIKTETHADLIFHFCDGSKLVFIGIQKNFINWKLINGDSVQCTYEHCVENASGLDGIHFLIANCNNGKKKYYKTLQEAAAF